jgi:hypothetical protein
VLMTAAEKEATQRYHLYQRLAAMKCDEE